MTEQIIKTRDDKNPLYFEINQRGDSAKPYSLKDGSACSWLAPGESFGPDKLRERIEPWLTAISQTDHVSLLIGSGLPQAIHRIATGHSLPGMSKAKFSCYDSNIDKASTNSAKQCGRSQGNIEDQIRAASELLRGLEILELADEKFKSSELRKDLEGILEDFANSVLAGENGLVTAQAEKQELAFNYLVSFLMSFSSRAGTRDRLHIFSTNYDRFIEAGADVAGLRLIDRFIGSLSPIFRSSRLDVDLHYNPPGIRGEPRYLEGVARFTKLHGSLDWVNANRGIHKMGIPFGADKVNTYLKVPGLSKASAMELMIYPNAAKDRETSEYPYVELFRDFSAAVCRPNSALVTYGYSFGDEHINRVIEDMLTIPSTHLVVMSYSDPLGRIMKMYEKLGRNAQITLIIGDHLGDFQTLVNNYLPKPAIDKTTFKMSELLKARWSSESHQKSEDETEKSVK